MPYLFGSETKTIFLKKESHKLFQEFEVGGKKATITFDADLIASNSVIGTINGVSTSAVVFAATHDATMALLVTELIAHADVQSASITSARVITVIAADKDAAFVLASWAVTLGATQAGVVTATDTNTVYKGQPIQLQSDGTIEPVINGNYAYKMLGVAIHDGVGGELVTVMMKPFAIVVMECATDSLSAGPVVIHSNGYNTDTGYVEVDDASVTAANQVGWALDTGDDGDVVRVALL